MLEFDAKTTAHLENAYHGADMVKRRMVNRDVLAPGTGDHIADIGCGPGLQTLELARAVGEEGQVVGIDPSEEMRQAALARCAEYPNIRILEGTVNALPLADESLDKAVSLQVFEYLTDIPAALTEVRRVLRPGGRLVVGDMHWDTLAWHSDNRERMSNILAAFDKHFTERRVPAILPAMMRDVGFQAETIVPLTFLDTTFRQDGYAKSLVHLIRGFVLKNELVDPAEVGAWATEQSRLAEEGRFFFTFTHVVVAGRKV